MKKTIYGVVGKGKLGSLLLERPDFVYIDCDITNVNSILRSYKEVDVLVNCAVISSIDKCEKEDRYAFRVNVGGAEKLMSVYGDRVLNISSDYVFGGWKIFPPTEKSTLHPINIYGSNKMLMEDFSHKYGAKVIRLSRTIDRNDVDISGYLHELQFGKMEIPGFFYRNYLTRSQAVDGIEYFVRNFKSMPSLVNFGSDRPVSFMSLMTGLASTIGLDSSNLVSRKEKSGYAPRPKRGGFSTGLARKLGFPMYSLDDVIWKFWDKS